MEKIDMEKKKIEGFIRNLEYEIFRKGWDTIKVIDKITFNNIEVGPDRNINQDNNNCGLQDWYDLLRLIDFIKLIKHRILSKCNVEVIFKFLASIVDNYEKVENYVRGKDNNNLEEVVKNVLKNIENCADENVRKFVNFRCIDDDVRQHVKNFLRNVLDDAIVGYLLRYIYYGNTCDISLALGKLHRLIEGLRRETIRQDDFCRDVREIVDLLPFSEYFKNLYNTGRSDICSCESIFQMVKNCKECYRKCANALRRNVSSNLKVYSAKVKGEIHRIYPYEENHKKWYFEGIIWFYIYEDGINVRTGIAQILYYSYNRGSFGSILLEFESDQDNNHNAISGKFRGRYIKLMRHEGDVLHVRANTFPVEWISRENICKYLGGDDLLRQLVHCR